MNHRTFHGAFFAASLVVLASPCIAFAQAAPAEPPTQAAASKPEMFDVLAEMDQVLFRALFDTCDLETLAGLVTDDFEMYHDKWGMIADSGAKFVANVKDGCERQKTGENFLSRRELVPGSLVVYPLNNYGAIQMGEHRFYRLTKGKPDELTEVAKFTNLWKKDGDKWKLARVLSYDHQPGR
ncbi:MAG TPA: nuclear transport factor 2 family protein [Thermoanaerobaculia bacterium]|nr:nuclear transport factor 2 family protein [Thermoanaerobaculia bacterium]